MIECAQRLVPAAEAANLANRALFAAHKPTKPRPPADDEKRVKAWLWTLLNFESMAFWKETLKERLETPLDDHVDAPVMAESPHWETTIENRQWLQRALSELSEDQQNLVIEYDVEEKSLAELSQASGINENTLSTRLRRAHHQLRAILIALAGGRLSAFVPIWLLRWLVPRDAENREPWTLRLRRAFRHLVRQPMHIGANVFAVACILGLAPGSPCAKDEPFDVAIAPEPAVSVTAELSQTGEVFPGTDAGAQAKSVETQIPSAQTSVAKKNAIVPQQAYSNDDDDRLLIRAKAALKRHDAKSALDFIAEHERRFPKSKNAGRRESLRAQALKMAKGKRP